MKLFDPIKKEVFLNIRDAMIRFCMGHHSCEDCPLNTNPVEPWRNCAGFCKEYPKRAAEIMGYIILEDDDVSMKKEIVVEQKHPTACEGMGRFCRMLCEALNIEPGEEWVFHGMRYHVRPSDGLIYFEEENAWVLMENVLKLADMVDHPEKIVRLNRWTEQEIKRARAIQVIYPEAKSLEKSESGIKVFSDKLVLATLDTELFPNLQDGQSVELGAVIGSDHNAELLNFFNCIRLLDACVKEGLIKQNPKDQNAILVYREAGEVYPEGWYSENLLDCAQDLQSDEEGQRVLLTALKERGIDFTPEPIGI